MNKVVRMWFVNMVVASQLTSCRLTPFVSVDSVFRNYFPTLTLHLCDNDKFEIKFQIYHYHTNFIFSHSNFKKWNF